MTGRDPGRKVSADTFVLGFGAAGRREMTGLGRTGTSLRSPILLGSSRKSGQCSAKGRRAGRPVGRPP